MAKIRCPYCGKEFTNADPTVGVPVPNPPPASREHIEADIQIKLTELRHAQEKYERDERDWYDRPQSYDRPEPGWLGQARMEVARLEAEVQQLKGLL